MAARKPYEVRTYALPKSAEGRAEAPAKRKAKKPQAPQEGCQKALTLADGSLARGGCNRCVLPVRRVLAAGAPVTSRHERAPGTFVSPVSLLRSRTGSPGFPFMCSSETNRSSNADPGVSCRVARLTFGFRRARYRLFRNRQI